MGYAYKVLSPPLAKGSSSVYVYDLGGGISVFSTFDIMGGCSVKDELVPPQYHSLHNCNNNVFLVKADNDLILFDAGFGDDINSASRVRFNFEEAGIDIDNIKTIVMTHLHPDHATGLTSGAPTLFGGVPTRRYSDAKIYIPKNELNFWLQKKLPEGIGSPLYYTKQKWAGHNTFFEFDSAIVKDMLSAYGENVVIFDTDFDGDIAEKSFIKKINLFGHTPGHTAYIVKGGDRDIIIAGDFVCNASVQIFNTSISAIYDFNFEEAKKSREALMKYALDNDIILATTHSPSPGFLKIVMR